MSDTMSPKVSQWLITHRLLMELFYVKKLKKLEKIVKKWNGVRSLNGGSVTRSFTFMVSTNRSICCRFSGVLAILDSEDMLSPEKVNDQMSAYNHKSPVNIPGISQ